MRYRTAGSHAEAAESLIAGIAPPSLSRRAMLAGWTAALLLLLTGLAASFAVVTPVYAFGTATVLTNGAGERILLLLPAEQGRDVAAGDTVTITSGAATAEHTVVSVEAEPRSAEEVATEYDLSQAVAAQLTGPVLLAEVEAPASIGGLPTADYAGAVFTVAAVVGERRTLPFMVRQFFTAGSQGAS
ncbi:hypothetical protein LO763_15925 [Glycomyces sp. A-F 0318]|uniref:hypothetical protein n=1 Tax=Glycomyces amatae TaxID=2881355 RepID=UPI001E4955B7|nr:hypothetical protein [Glycomyces amatae]MCD0445105.1 hypothetical protein [Glycomyces amatae]